MNPHGEQTTLQQLSPKSILNVVSSILSAQLPPNEAQRALEELGEVSDPKALRTIAAAVDQVFEEPHELWRDSLSALFSSTDGGHAGSDAGHAIHRSSHPGQQHPAFATNWHASDTHQQPDSTTSITFRDARRASHELQNPGSGLVMPPSPRAQPLSGNPMPYASQTHGAYPNLFIPTSPFGHGVSGGSDFPDPGAQISGFKSYLPPHSLYVQPHERHSEGGMHAEAGRARSRPSPILSPPPSDPEPLPPTPPPLTSAVYSTCLAWPDAPLTPRSLRSQFAHHPGDARGEPHAASAHTPPLSGRASFTSNRSSFTSDRDHHPLPEHSGGMRVQGVYAAPTRPFWCVVSGQRRPPHNPLDGPPTPDNVAHVGVEGGEVVSIWHLLPWPNAVVDMLSRGLLFLTAATGEIHFRAGKQLPVVMFAVPTTAHAHYKSTLSGLTRADLFSGRASLERGWRVPEEWRGDGSNISLGDLDGLRLVLTFQGYTLLPNFSCTMFLITQSHLNVMATTPQSSTRTSVDMLTNKAQSLSIASPPGGQHQQQQLGGSGQRGKPPPSISGPHGPCNPLAAGSHSSGNLESRAHPFFLATASCASLLWQVARSATAAVTALAAKCDPAPFEAAIEQAPSADSRARGSWLQRLNHHKQRYDINVAWVDWQDVDLTWSTHLLVNGSVAVKTEGGAKKQDARDEAARIFLLSVHGQSPFPQQHVGASHGITRGQPL